MSRINALIVYRTMLKIKSFRVTWRLMEPRLAI